MKNRNNALSIIFTPRGKNAGLLALRVFAGLMMMPHAIAKIASFGTLSESFANPLGLGSTASLIAIIAVELGGSFCIIAGAATRLAALALMFGMAIAAFIAHAPFTLSGSELPLLYLGIFGTLFITGAGRWSVDQWIYAKYFHRQ